MFKSLIENLKSWLSLNRFRVEHSVLGKEVSIEGILRFKGIVHLEGRLIGKIYSEGTLYIGPNAVVEAQLDVARLIVTGKLTGLVRASDHVELRKNAHFSGQIEAPRLIMESSAVFAGDFKTTCGEEVS